MAKSTRTKKATALTEPIVEETTIETPEPVIEETTVDELVVTEVIPEPAEVIVEVPADLIKAVAKVEPTPIVLTDNSHLELPMEQRIENFLEGKDGYVRANDFLKSLFGIPKFNEPAKWLIQGNSKLLKATLEKMVANNDIVVRDNQHRLLGQSYYPDSATGKQEHRNLNNVEIFMKK